MDNSIMALSAWLEIPNNSDFSLNNIPFGVCSLTGEASSRKRCVTAIGDKVIDLSILEDAGCFSDISNLSATVFSQPTLNAFLAHPHFVWQSVRERLINLFKSNGGDETIRSNLALQKSAFYETFQVMMHLPVEIGDYTDFYSSREHATNVGTMFRGKDNALQPNWLHLPVGYHGRSSTIFPSGQPIRRPRGQLQKDPKDPKKGSVYGPSKLMDFELEMAFFVGGPPNPPGESLTMEQAKQRIFGFCLMNDWSARDVQAWEYVPLGPFTAKNFGTTISPWIIPTQALDIFACPTSAQAQTDPKPLPYLQDPTYSSYDIHLEVSIQPEGEETAHTICKSNLRNLYWNAAQQLVHHSVTGCVLRAGDLLASGTISGQTQDSFGSMLELSWKGSREVPVGKQVRKFLKDGDTVIMKGFGYKEGHGRVGFGECSGKLLPALVSDPPASKEEKVTPTMARYQDFKLYSYWRSSSSWRVRIALQGKGILYESIPVNLKQGEQCNDGFLEKNSMGQVPVFECTDTSTGEVVRMTQSLAIMEFIDHILPDRKSLFPQDPMDKIAAVEMVEIINSGIQPLQNAPMVMSLERASEGKIVAKDFAQNAISRGLKALEKLVEQRQEKYHGPFCMGNFSPTLVDACLIPQIYNARRFGVDMEMEFPTLAKIDRLCATHPWFVSAAAHVQVDAEE
jgi:fumarylacetoacetase